MEKLEQKIIQKPKRTNKRMTGKQTTITYSNSQRTKETLGLHTVPSKSIGTVNTKLLCWLWSQDIYKYD